jgi:hypothetical protein
MEEVIINEPSLFQTLVSSPTTYIVLLIVVLTIVGLKKGNSSTKCCESNKTSTPTTPKRARTNKGKFVADDPKTPKNEAWVGGKAPRKKATKKTPTKKRATKKNATKRTPKKSGIKN